MSTLTGGIYVHIPFCRQACVYCDFHFLTSLKHKREMVQAIQQEAQLQADFFPHQQPLQTLYFGGGTPSVLSVAELASLIQTFQAHFSFAAEAEITLEANPDDLSEDYLHAIRALGVNRLSIGTQSFAERDLRWMNRSHSAEQAIRSLELAQQVGFDNLSIDLIFGLPDADPAHWEKQLQQAIQLPVQHLSLYALTVEEKTVLAHQVRQGQTTIPDDPVFGQQFLFAHDFLEAAGFAHYELSNYALPGFRSRHNSAYWKGAPYLGLGPSAHSYDGKSRSWNLSHNAQYLKHLGQGQLAIAETEILKTQDRYHEYVMTHLRKKEGIDQVLIEQNWLPDWGERFAKALENWVTEGLMVQNGPQYTLTPEGWLVSDGIIGDLFL